MPECCGNIQAVKSAPNIMHTDFFIQNGMNFHTFQTTHNGRVQKHSHEFHEIIYITDGFTLHSIGGTMNLLVTGDLLFIKPGEEHSYINAYQTKLYNLLFTADELNGFIDDLRVLPGLGEMFTPARSNEEKRPDGQENEKRDLNARVIHVPISERRSIESALTRMCDEVSEKRTGWVSLVKSQLAAFLIRYSRMYEDQWDNRSHAGSDYFGYIYKVLRYIDENFSREITMNDLSEVTGLSSDYMSRKFKEVLHMPPSEYLRKFRIARAMELLCTTELSVAEVAEKTGFSDVSLFSRVFKQAVGLPPASYKKNAGALIDSGSMK